MLSKKISTLKINTDDCHSVRLYSTKTFKALGTLIYHKVAVQSLAFARAHPVAARRHHQHFPTGSTECGEEGGAPVAGISADSIASQSGDCNDGEEDVVVADDDYDDSGCGDVDEDGDEMSTEEKARRSRWLVSGGKDGRVAVWALMDFTARKDNEDRRVH